MAERAASWAILDRVEAEYDFSATGRFSLFSGGHDSLANTSVCTAWARERGVEMKVVHISTGIGIPETREFVEAVCEARGWPLLVYRASDYGVTYEWLVMKYGFPGPAHHNLCYNLLKQRALRALVRDHKRDRADRVLLCSGVRAQESQRRFAGTKVIEHRREGAQVWVNPIVTWSKRDCLDEIERAGLPRNPVVDKLHKSGECLCGAFARKGEIEELELWYPEVAAEIHALEAKVEAAGHDRCRWGVKTRPVHPDQLRLLGPLCSSCVQVPAA